MTVELEWPPHCLQPNARVHWRKKGEAAKRYRAAAGWSAMAAGYKDLSHYTGLSLHITFHPPSARRADVDNMLASIKHGLDGIADATLVNDSNFEITIKKSTPIKGGKVSIAITGINDEQGS